MPPIFQIMACLVSTTHVVTCSTVLMTLITVLFEPGTSEISKAIANRTSSNLYIVAYMKIAKLQFKMKRTAIVTLQ